MSGSSNTRSIVDRLRLSDPELAVFVSGVTSIGLEILAGRVVAPEFGNSIYTWGSIIGVFLGALGLGYHVGGKRAPERASRRALALLLTQSALFVAFLLAADAVVLQSADALPVPARFASLLPVTVLFGPPVFLLGFISPYAAELSAEPTAGSASGRVYMLGTVGSLVGSFGTTFLLVPAFGVAEVELAFGALLVATALVVGVTPSRDRLLRAGLVLLALSGAFAVNGYGLTTPGDTVLRTQTEYQELRVVDQGNVRTLYLDGAPQSATYLDDTPGYVYEYPRYLHLPMLMTDDVDDVLFVGGGGFSAPQRYLAEYPNVSVDVVELDPAVVDAAERYFGVERSPRLSIHVGDGRQFLEETDTEYDVIVLDAYRKDQVPFHLTTVEFMELASARLDADGVLVANVISAADGPGSEFYRAQYATMQRAFPHVYAFPTSGTAFLQNIELVATNREEGFSRAELARRARDRADYVGLNLTDAVANYRDASQVPTEDVPVITDRRGSVDSLLDPQLGRRYAPSESTDDANDTATAAERVRYRPPSVPGAGSGVHPSTMSTPALAPIRSAPAANIVRAVP